MVSCVCYNDGQFPDTLDVDSLLSIFSGGPCSTSSGPPPRR